MNTFTGITALFTVYSNNFKAMHWFACGKSFDRIHKLTESYYDMTADDLDVLAEMAMRINQRPATISKAVSILESYEGRNFMIMSDGDVDYVSFHKMSDIMLKDICWAIEQLLADDILQVPSNVGIKATLEGLHDKYDIQCRYLNARRGHDLED